MFCRRACGEDYILKGETLELHRTAAIWFGGDLWELCKWAAYLGFCGLLMGRERGFSIATVLLFFFF